MCYCEQVHFPAFGSSAGQFLADDADGLLGRDASGNLWIKTTPVPPLAQAPEPGEAVGPEHVRIGCTDVPQAQAYLQQHYREQVAYGDWHVWRRQEGER